MAGAAAAQVKLDRIVRIIATDMAAEVCSVYILRAGEVLELFATKGLNPKAVHQTRLRVGEGLVGHIAAHPLPLALANAQAHPGFVYRPETGEDPYRSLLGVPILHSGKVAGVLVVQNRKARRYSDEEVEALEITAMAVAELVAGGDLVDPLERAPADGNAILPLRLEGVPLNGGFAMGTAVLHRPDVAIRQVVADNPEAELVRLRQAFAELQNALETLFGQRDIFRGGEPLEILEAFRLIAADTGWLERIRDAVRSGLTAEAAVQQIRDSMRVRMGQVADPYLRERLAEIDDVAVRLLRNLTRSDPAPDPRSLPEDVILVARRMGPAELLDYETGRLRGLILEEGSPTSHIAILARALDIPVIGQVKEAFAKIQAGDPILIDAENRQVFVRPAEDVQQAFNDALTLRAAQRRAFAELRDKPAITLDGRPIALNINAALEFDLPQLHLSGADGIGLFRTEIPFMMRAAYPDVEAQTALYRSIFDQSRDKPVVFRTLDVGGDKPLPYFEADGGENPALGWRAIRIGLDRPAMLRQQIRALIRAAAGRDLAIMFPMITMVAEYDRAMQILRMEQGRERALGGVLPRTLRVGAMLEVPALLWQLPELLERVDFLSVGSNDLFQFLLAADRANTRVSERFDVLSPAPLRMLRDLARQCEKASVPLSLCGEMAGNPLEAMALIGVGLRSISMAPRSIGRVKAMIRGLHLGALDSYLATILPLPAASLRDRLQAFARDHGVPV